MSTHRFMPVATKLIFSAFFTVRRILVVPFFLMLPLAEPLTRKSPSTGTVGIGMAVGTAVGAGVGAAGAFSSWGAAASCLGSSLGAGAVSLFVSCLGSSFGAGAASCLGSSLGAGAASFFVSCFGSSLGAGAAVGTAVGAAVGALVGAAVGAGASTTVSTSTGCSVLSANTLTGILPLSIVMMHRMERYLSSR